ncbi:MAG TPA: GH1 family beta-glucosidase [Ktedonobacteraceae bacterium]|jgi:beta-glucosidase|nr:GH1 family beta-glucosidase [Ktedonobacteraceae bacterium]
MNHFPEGFTWGAATAAYQVEGATTEDGRGESIWDRFCSVPGNIKNQESGAVACDHYHRYLEDIQLMRDLGLRAYRFSIAWPRILPQGRGEVNEAGLDFYERLVDAVLAAGLEPFVTLYHWDLPQALQSELGGWASRETPRHFAHYVDIVSRRLSDRVKRWITLNEPYVSAFLGYETGIHAPGLHNSRLAWQASHHLLLGHGMAVPVLRANGGADTRVGITLDISPVYANSDDENDLYVARVLDSAHNRWFLDPIFRGSYPAITLSGLGNRGIAPQIEQGDTATISQPLDFLGVNHYSRTLVRQKPDAEVGAIDWMHPENAEYTEMNWEIYPQGLYDVLMRLHKDYKIPSIYITENGAAFADSVGEDGYVHDERRIDFYRGYLQQAHKAIEEGVPLQGYFAWSLLDNFEWAEGYSKRFGIVHVDYSTQQRIIKDSGFWYRDVIQANALA